MPSGFVTECTKLIQNALPPQTPYCQTLAALFKNTPATKDPEEWLLDVANFACEDAHANLSPQDYATWKDERSQSGECKTRSGYCGAYIYNRLMFIRDLAYIAPYIMVHLEYTDGSSKWLSITDLLTTSLQNTVPDACGAIYLPPDHILHAHMLKYLSFVYISGTETSTPPTERKVETLLHVMRWRQRKKQLEMTHNNHTGAHVLTTLVFDQKQCLEGRPCNTCRTFGCRCSRLHPVPPPPDSRASASIVSVRDWKLMLCWYQRSLIGWESTECIKCRLHKGSPSKVQPNTTPGKLPYTYEPCKRRSKTGQQGSTPQRMKVYNLLMN